MSNGSEAMSAQPLARDAAPAAVLPWTRLFAWSVRRELWEHRALYIAPLAIVGFALFTFLVTSFRLPGAIRAAEAADRTARTIDPGNVEAFAAAAKAASTTAGVFENPYDTVAGVAFLTTVIVAVFYSLSALHNERRDRSILFWKSLPVSDLITVLSKASIPLAAAPVVIFTIAVSTHLVMLAWSTFVLLANGLDPGALTAHLPFPFLWLALARGLVVMALWYAPVVAWLLLVSGWARRVPFLWAILPWVALTVVERVAFSTMNVYLMLESRLAGGYITAFTVNGQGKTPVEKLADLSLAPVLSNPDLWIGLAFAAACLAAAVRLRRYRDPI